MCGKPLVQLTQTSHLQALPPNPADSDIKIVAPSGTTTESWLASYPDFPQLLVAYSNGSIVVSFQLPVFYRWLHPLCDIKLVRVYLWPSSVDCPLQAEPVAG